MEILLKQNKLPGQYTGMIVTSTDKGRLLKFFADPELWSELLKRRENPGQTKLWLKMGLTPVKFALSKSKETTPTVPAESVEEEAEPTVTPVTV